jgi:hypothetical protein
MNETALHRYDTQAALRQSVGTALNDLTVSDANGAQRVFELSLHNGKAQTVAPCPPVAAAPGPGSEPKAPTPAAPDPKRADGDGPDAVLALAVALAPPPTTEAAFTNRAADAHDVA